MKHERLCFIGISKYREESRTAQILSVVFIKEFSFSYMACDIGNLSNGQTNQESGISQIIPKCIYSVDSELTRPGQNSSIYALCSRSPYAQISKLNIK